MWFYRILWRPSHTTFPPRTSQLGNWLDARGVDLAGVSSYTRRRRRKLFNPKWPIFNSRDSIPLRILYWWHFNSSIINTCLKQIAIRRPDEKSDENSWKEAEHSRARTFIPADQAWPAGQPFTSWAPEAGYSRALAADAYCRSDRRWPLELSISSGLPFIAETCTDSCTSQI